VIWEIFPLLALQSCMPAIQPARMKIQVASLSEKMRQPEAFVRALHDLLDFYADRTYRPGQSGEPPPLLATYKPPAPVLRQIERETASFAASDPPATLVLIDALWAEPYIEFRLLAIILLGRIPPNPPEPVLERVLTWILSMPEDRLLDAILKNGLQRLRQEFPTIYFQMIEAWLKAEGVYSRRTGLRAIVSWLEDLNFENFPVIFQLLTPLIRVPPASLRIDLVTVLHSLAHRIPQETSYILRQNLSDDRPDTAWLARQVLRDFPSEIQNGLRSALRQFGTS
jgi:hypothetical protein